MYKREREKETHIHAVLERRESSEDDVVPGKKEKRNRNSGEPDMYVHAQTDRYVYI